MLLYEVGTNSKGCSFFEVRSVEMDQKVKSVIDRLCGQLERLYGEGVKGVVLYGSHALGTATLDSDVDVLVVVDDLLNPWDVRKDLGDLLVEFPIDNHLLVSVIVVTESFYRDYRSPFLQNVKREGILL